MHFSLWILAPLVALSAAKDPSIQVNDFSDGGCSAYVLSVHPFTNGKCYDYQYSGTNSAGITNCDNVPKGFTCYCQLYTGGGCTGASQLVDYRNAGNRCASNYGHGFESMQCWVGY